MWCSLSAGATLIAVAAEDGATFGTLLQLPATSTVCHDGLTPTSNARGFLGEIFPHLSKKVGQMTGRSESP